MLNSNETFVKDIEFKEFEDNTLRDIIKEYKSEYKKKSNKKRKIVLVEVILLFMLTVFDLLRINVSILLLIGCIVLFAQYLMWGFGKISKMSKHYDIDSFFKDIDKELSYIEVICDDIAKEGNDSYVVLLSTLDSINIMEKITMPYVDKMRMDFDRKKESDKPKIYMIKSGITYFAVESIDSKWWKDNIQCIIR